VQDAELVTATCPFHSGLPHLGLPHLPPQSRATPAPALRPRTPERLRDPWEGKGHNSGETEASSPAKPGSSDGKQPGAGGPTPGWLLAGVLQPHKLPHSTTWDPETHSRAGAWQEQGQSRWAGRTGRGSTIEGDLRARGREKCRDVQDETLTSAPAPPAPRQPARPQKADPLTSCHLNNRPGRGRQPDRETGASRHLLSRSTQFTAGAAAGIPAWPYALRAASITPRRSRGLHGSWEGEEGAMGEAS